MMCSIKLPKSVKEIDEVLSNSVLVVLSAGLAESALSALGSLILESGSERVEAWGANRTNKAFVIMKQHVEHSECLIIGFKCLAWLGRPVVHNGALVDGITQGLLLHAPMEGNQHVSPTSIFDSSSCLGWLVLEALHRYPRNAAVVANAMWASANLCLSTKQKQSLIQAGVLHAVLDILRQYELQKEAVERTLSCMINLILPADGYSLLKLRKSRAQNSNRMFCAFRMSLP
jgi:hypothetical protein